MSKIVKMDVIGRVVDKNRKDQRLKTQGQIGKLGGGGQNVHL